MATIKQVEIDESWIWIAGFLTLVVLYTYVSGRVAGKRDQQDKQGDYSPNAEIIGVSTDSGAIEWDPSSLIKRVHTEFVTNGGFWSKDDAGTVFAELIRLQDIQMRALADGYKKAYGKTLRYVLNESWSSSGYAYELRSVNDHLNKLSIV